MKKTAIILALAIASAFAGCSSNKSETAQESSASPAQTKSNKSCNLEQPVSALPPK